MQSRLAMTNSPAQRPTDHWSDYWARGSLTSLPDDFSGNYDGEIAAFWAERFKSLPEPARILDICTGNGALALLAADHAISQSRTFEITAVDAARIRPDLIAEGRPDLANALGRIRFVPDTPMEAFQAPAAHFDLAMSQYGIEYCDQAAVAPIIAGLLKPGAELALLCHASSSDMLKTMQGELAEYQRLDALGLVRTLRAWLKDQLDSSRLRRQLARVAQAIYPDYQARRSPLFGFVLQAINQIARLDERGLRQQHDQFKRFLVQLESGRQRLDDMLRVNRLLEADDWHQPYLDAGLELVDQGDLFYRQQHHVGRWFVFCKA
ncbi:MAG: class I SAM-dependent methyltransferase [Wenzhouxiangella sp.]|nr:MAG: class I SAM-dependent methyltransferase [Wenzhouxiangella sp.]